MRSGEPLVRLLREPADGLVAEHRLEHPLREQRGAADDAHLGAREPAGGREDRDHQDAHRAR